MSVTTIVINGNTVTGEESFLASLLGSTPAKAAPAESTFMTKVHDKRIARRESTVLGGLTSAERKFLSAQWFLTHTERYTPEEWAAVVTAYKASTK